MNKNKRIAKRLQGVAGGFLVVFSILLFHGPAQGASFCVGTAAQLVSALRTAEVNGEDDVMQVIQGTYIGNFVYSSSEAKSLTIEGGFLTGCPSWIVDPSKAILDGIRTGTALV